MTLYSKATLTRTRILLDTADVGAITNALVTGMPVPVPMDATDSCTPHYLAHECVFEQFILRDYARFPVLDQDRVVADHDMISAAFFLSGVQDTYLDFVTIVYDGADTHAAAVVWRADRGARFAANDAVYFGRGFTEGAFSPRPKQRRSRAMSYPARRSPNRTIPTSPAPCSTRSSSRVPCVCRFRGSTRQSPCSPRMVPTSTTACGTNQCRDTAPTSPSMPRTPARSSRSIT